MIDILVGFIIGGICGFIFCSMIRNRAEVGTLYIDFTDRRKDLVRLELNQDLDEFIDEKQIVLNVSSKTEKDFKQTGGN